MCGVVYGHLAVAIVTGGEGHPIRLVLLEMTVFLTTTLQQEDTSAFECRLCTTKPRLHEPFKQELLTADPVMMCTGALGFVYGSL